MSWYDETEPKEIIGKTLQAWRETDAGGTIYLEFTDGTEAKFFHRQDCCECVSLHGDSYKELDNFIGREITGFLQDENAGTPEYRYGSATLTEITFTFGNESVRACWWGESNGYYSESVDFWCSWSNDSDY